MARSYDPSLYHRVYRNGAPAPRTPGPLGTNDGADPRVMSRPGDSPGPLGVNDHANDTTFAGRLRSTRQSGALRVMLLDKDKLAAFLRSVAYDQATADLTKPKTERIGIFFTATEVDIGSEATKKRLADEKLAVLHRQFAKAAAQGSKAIVDFLLEQERARDEARGQVKEVFKQSSEANKKTEHQLGTTVKVLKTVEVGAGGVITVAGLFVSAPAALAAGAIGFGYDTVTHVIDNVGKSRKMDAAAVALVSQKTGEDSGVAAIKEAAKGKLGGAELEEVERLEKSVQHLTEKIKVKQDMIMTTKSLHNKGKLSRALAKDEAALAAADAKVTRFWGVNILFAGWDLWDRYKDLNEVWRQE